MVKLRGMKRYLASLTLTLCCLSGLTHASSAPHLDKSILNHYTTATITPPTPSTKGSLISTLNELYAKLNPHSKHSMLDRLAYFSAFFLEKPYVLFPLGEGHPSEYDEMPRARLDSFDCETYVDTVLALSFAKNPQAFEHCLDTIRYEKGAVSFTTRNHFTSLDWNQHNQENGYLEDITTRLLDRKHHPVAKYATTVINKKGWYEKLPLSFIRIPNLNFEERQKRLNKLHAEGKRFQAQKVKLAYIPLKTLLGKDGAFLQQQIPSGAIIEIVRPHWALQAIIGTDLDVSHLGFAFWKDHTLYFRQASSVAHQVIDTPLLEYLKALSKNPTIGGINIQIIKVKTPLNQC